MNTKQEAPAQQPVKVSHGKNKFDRKFRPYLSDKDTKPLNDVWDGKKTIEGLTEEEKIAEGIFPPLAWQSEKDEDGNPIGRFRKTDKEREELSNVHTNKKGPTGGGRRNAGRGEFTSTLIIHRANVYRKKDFQTTISLQAKPSQVGLLLSAYHDPEKRKLVTKYHYAGKTYTIE
jgi:hypothetical protein